MAKEKLSCRVCEPARPKCDKGREIHSRMTAKFLESGLQVTESHKENWKEWLEHTHK